MIQHGWTAITFNPKDMAENLKNFGTFIPGYRPGKRTADYLEKVMVRITYVGAGFLAMVAVIPTMISGSLGVSFMVASFYGGAALVLVTVFVIGCGTSSDAGSPSGSPEGLTSCDAQYLSSGDAGTHLGQQVTVCGKIVDYYYATGDARKPTLSLFDQEAPREGQRRILKPDDQFSVVVWGEEGKSFPANFAASYVGKMVCATGIVEVYDENPVIIATTPGQLVEGC